MSNLLNDLDQCEQNDPTNLIFFVALIRSSDTAKIFVSKTIPPTYFAVMTLHLLLKTSHRVIGDPDQSEQNDLTNITRSDENDQSDRVSRTVHSFAFIYLLIIMSIKLRRFVGHRQACITNSTISSKFRGTWLL